MKWVESEALIKALNDRCGMITIDGKREQLAPFFIGMISLDHARRYINEITYPNRARPLPQRKPQQMGNEIKYGQYNRPIIDKWVQERLVPLMGSEGEESARGAGVGGGVVLGGMTAAEAEKLFLQHHQHLRPPPSQQKSGTPREDTDNNITTENEKDNQNTNNSEEKEDDNNNKQNTSSRGRNRRNTQAKATGGI